MYKCEHYVIRLKPNQFMDVLAPAIKQDAAGMGLTHFIRIMISNKKKVETFNGLGKEVTINLQSITKTIYQARVCVCNGMRAHDDMIEVVET
jgi:hypothetical protein